MSLSDVVGGSGLHSWSELGLVVSFITFIALLIWLFVVRRGTAFERESRLPLQDAPAAPATAGPDATAESALTEEVDQP